jgi:hypothetical protein
MIVYTVSGLFDATALMGLINSKRKAARVANAHTASDGVDLTLVQFQTIGGLFGGGGAGYDDDDDDDDALVLKDGQYHMCDACRMPINSNDTTIRYHCQGPTCTHTHTHTVQSLNLSGHDAYTSPLVE